jgi:hypothetical protein
MNGDTPFSVHRPPFPFGGPPVSPKAGYIARGCYPESAGIFLSLDTSESAPFKELASGTNLQMPSRSMLLFESKHH